MVDFDIYSWYCDIQNSLLWQSDGFDRVPCRLLRIDRQVHNWSTFTHNEAWHQYHLFREYYFDVPTWDDCVKLHRSVMQRKHRMRDRVFTIAREPSVFVRLSFTDEVLASTSPETRRQYVSRRLKALSDFYVANIDFGSATEREHYHGVIRMPWWNPNDRSLWPYGFVDVERVRCSGDADDPKSYSRLANYSAKLALHSLKESTKLSRIIYSRNGKAKITDFQVGRQEDAASAS